MITSEQIRSARLLVRITADQLAKASCVGLATIRRFELMEGVQSGNARLLEAIQRAIENEGVEFIGTPDVRPGFRLKQPIAGTRKSLRSVGPKTASQIWVYVVSDRIPVKRFFTKRTDSHLDRLIKFPVFP